jgi:hypothetical protein
MEGELKAGGREADVACFYQGQSPPPPSRITGGGFSAAYTPPREEVFMEGPLELNMGPSLADVLLCTFASTNAGFSSFPLRKLLSCE